MSTPQHHLSFLWQFDSCAQIIKRIIKSVIIKTKNILTYCTKHFKIEKLSQVLLATTFKTSHHPAELRVLHKNLLF